jgi:hypothetical protein
VVERYVLTIKHYSNGVYVGSAEISEEYTAAELEQKTNGPIREQYHKAIDIILCSQD